MRDWSKKLLNDWLDASVLFSFDSSGFVRHSRNFAPFDGKRLAGKTVLLTGANSGIGLAATEALVQFGARVVMLVRNPQKGQTEAERIRAQNPKAMIEVEQLDVSEPGSIHDFCRRWQQRSESQVHVLIHNAGVLIPTESGVQRNSLGEEMSWATNFLGAVRLTQGLRQNLEAADRARVIMVSSGGMYLQMLDLRDPSFERRPYHGVMAYANSKRAQVLWTELAQTKESNSNISYLAMHPGWVQTPGLSRSLPAFTRWLQSRLRTPEQGADTIVWLAGATQIEAKSGCLFFDRHVVPANYFGIAKTRVQDREKLWSMCLALK